MDSGLAWASSRIGRYWNECIDADSSFTIAWIHEEFEFFEGLQVTAELQATAGLCCVVHQGRIESLDSIRTTGTIRMFYPTISLAQCPTSCTLACAPARLC